ncbi:MAG: CotH kinase family protein [Gemmataceae bacterium]|nr:CotH kinase family protein [Gemmataceae bacterium]
MSSRVLAVGVFVLAAHPAWAQEPPVFGHAAIHQVHIEVSAKDYKAMDPPPVNLFAPRPKAQEGRPAPGSPDAGAGNMMYEFEYVPAAVSIDGQLFPKIGLRYKGSGTYLMSQTGAKRSLKFDFDHYDSKIAYRDLKKLNLNSGVVDPTKAREALAYEVFRAAGVPAPRTGFADVTITVPGKFDREFLGVYTIVEQVDKSFLKAHFGNGKGLLLKPEGIRGLPYLGDTRAAVEKAYNAKSGEEDEAAWKRLVELTRLINKSTDAEFRSSIRQYLDVDNATRFLAATAILASLDSFIGLGHNYYLYLSPKTNTFHFLPWDLDLAFGGFMMFGTPDQQANFSIERPHMGENKLIDRLFAMPEVKVKYREHVKRLHADLFASGKLAKDAAAIEALVKESIVKEKAAATKRKEDFAAGNPFAPKPFPIAEFIQKRSAAVGEQLAGRSQGMVPGANFGGPPQGPGAQLAKPLLDSLDSDKDGKVSEAELEAGMKKHFREWDKNRNGTLDQRELAEGLQKLMPRR